MALPVQHGQTIHGMEVPNGYSVVGVEQIVSDDYGRLELDIPGGDGEKH